MIVSAGVVVTLDWSRDIERELRSGAGARPCPQEAAVEGREHRTSILTWQTRDIKNHRPRILISQ